MSTIPLGITVQRQFHCFCGSRKNGSRTCQADRLRSRSGQRSRSLPRLFRTSPLRCHSLKMRLAVNSVTFAVLANSSFVTSSSTPPETFRPILGAMVVSTWTNLWRALLRSTLGSFPGARIYIQTQVTAHYLVISDTEHKSLGSYCDPTSTPNSPSLLLC